MTVWLIYLDLLELIFLLTPIIPVLTSLSTVLFTFTELVANTSIVEFVVSVKGLSTVTFLSWSSMITLLSRLTSVSFWDGLVGGARWMVGSDVGAGAGVAGASVHVSMPGLQLRPETLVINSRKMTKHKPRLTTLLLFRITRRHFAGDLGILQPMAPQLIAWCTSF